MLTAPLLVYVRVSKVGDREESDKFRSPTQQEDRARAHAEAHGYTVGEVATDLDVSGAVHPSERPGMAKALEMIRDGEAGGLVAFSIDRLSRDPSHGDWLVKEITSHGGVVLAPDLPEDITSPTGEFTFGMLLGVARLYRRTAGDRFKLAAHDAVRRGIPHGKVPFGYRQLEDRTIEPDPETAPTVVDIFESRLRGEGWGSLAVRLAASTGRAWARHSLSHIVANPLYRTGRLRIGDTLSEADSGVIVDEATWHAAQSPKFIRDGRTAKGKWLLTGLLRCDACGHTLRPWKPPASRRDNTSRRYRCTNNPHCTAKVSVHGPMVEDMVTRAAFEIDMRLVAEPAPTIDLAPLQDALAMAERRYEHVQSPDSMDALGDDWAATVKARRNERDAAATALGAARAEAGIAFESLPELRLGHVWDDLDPQAQRQALQWLYSEIRAAKVPRGTEPALTYVARATRPWCAIEFAPADIEQI